MKNFMLFKGITSVPLMLLLPILLCFSLSAVAKAGEGDVEKIDVIGSHIKRTNVEGPSPVLVIDREQIEMSGHTSLADVFQELPIASSGSALEASLNSPSSQTGTGIRGQKLDSILYMLNGQRLSSYGGSTYFDLTLLPLSVIERIEVLPDSGSALYGSDALAVINVVTKKDQSGGQVSVQGSLVQREEGNNIDAISSFFDFWNWNETGLPEGETSWRGKGDKLKIDASYGGTKNDTNYLIGGQVRFDAPLYLADREFGKLISATKGSAYGSPGSYLWSEGAGENTKTHIRSAKDCPEGNKKESGICGFDWSPYMQFAPQVFQTSAFGQIDMPLMDNLNFTGQAIYSWTRSHSILAPAPDSFDEPVGDSPDYRIPVETANKWGISAGGPITVLYRPVEEKGSGRRETILNTHFYQTHLGLSKLFGNTMELEGYLNLSGSYYSAESKGYLNKETLFNMAKEGTFNPFKPSGQKDDISSATYEPTKSTFDNLVSFEPQLTGELPAIAGQPLMFAVGALGAHQYYMQDNDDITTAGKQWGGGVAENGEGDRFFGAFYGELVSHLFEVAEIQLAARSDYYSDFGLAWQEKYVPLPFSPLAKISIQPLDELKFRISWGLGFKAPSLYDLYHDKTVSFPFGPDYVQCTKQQISAEKCPERQYKALTHSNNNLKPEFFESFNVGVVLEPVDRFSISLDYYRTDREDMMVIPAIGDIFEHEDKRGVSFINNSEQKVIRGPDGTVQYVDRKSYNMSQYKVQGIDLTADLTLSLMSGWDMGFAVQHSHLIYVEQQVFKNGIIENPVPYYEWMIDWFGLENADTAGRKNNISFPTHPRWRNRATLSVMNKDMGHKIDLIVHNTPVNLSRKKAQKENFTDKNPIEKHTNEYYWQLDLRGKFSLTKDLSLIAGIKNVLGFQRPIIDKEAYFPGAPYPYISYDSEGRGGIYSLRGRSVDLRLTYDF